MSKVNYALSTEVFIIDAIERYRLKNKEMSPKKVNISPIVFKTLINELKNRETIMKDSNTLILIGVEVYSCGYAKYPYMVCHDNTVQFL